MLSGHRSLVLMLEAIRLQLRLMAEAKLEVTPDTFMETYNLSDCYAAEALAASKEEDDHAPKS